MMSRGSSSELEMPDGGAPTPLKVEIEEVGFPPGIWKILLGGMVLYAKATQRVSSGNWELERSSLCLRVPRPPLLSATPSPTTTLAPQQLGGLGVTPGLSSLSWRLGSW